MTYIQPVLPVLLVLIAFALLRKQSTVWKRIGLAAVAALFLWSWAPFAALFAYTLERRYPVAPPPPQEVGAIVVLSAGVYPAVMPEAESIPGLNTYLRCRYAAWLYRHWRAVPVFAAGGRDPRNVMLSDVMRRVLQAEGVASSAIFTEENSTSTYTNAVFTAAMLRARGIRKVALVTEALHMWRSELCFRKQGIEVVAAPCAFRSAGFEASWDNLIPKATALSGSGDALHEWIGMAWYRVSGKL